MTCVLGSFFVACTSNAWSAPNVTIKGLEQKQRELIQAKLQSEINKLKEKSTTKKESVGTQPPQNVLTPQLAPSKTAKPIDDIQLVAVYGVGDDLQADILANDAVVTVKQGDVVDGWKVKLVRPSRIVMAKKGKVKDFMMSVNKTHNDDRNDFNQGVPPFDQNQYPPPYNPAMPGAVQPN